MYIHRQALRDLIPPDAVIVSTTKGLHSETLEMMTQVIPRALGRPQPMCFFSGPSFAKVEFAVSRIVSAFFIFNRGTSGGKCVVFGTRSFLNAARCRS